MTSHRERISWSRWQAETRSDAEQILQEARAARAQYLSTSTVPVQDRQGVEVDRVTAMPSVACNYSLTICEYSHSLTTSNLSLETLAKLVQTVGRQFAEEMAGLPAGERHSLEMRIEPESALARRMPGEPF